MLAYLWTFTAYRENKRGKGSIRSALNSNEYEICNFPIGHDIYPFSRNTQDVTCLIKFNVMIYFPVCKHFIFTCDIR